MMHRPNIFVLLWRLLTCMKWKSFSFLGRIGALMLVLNIPFGWGGALTCAIIAARSAKPDFWCVVSGVIYAISWLMLALGVLLTDKEFRLMLKKRCKYTIGGWKRARAIAAGRNREDN